MLTSLILAATSLIVQYGTLGIFLLGIMEEIFLPVPSSFTLMAAGFFMLGQDFSILELLIRAVFLIAVPGALGLAIGSIFFYSLGRFGGKPLIIRFGRIVGLTWDKVEKMENRLQHSNKDEWTLFVLRSIPVIPNIAISALCGIVRYPFRPFFLIAFTGNIVRGIIMAFAGFITGEAYRAYAASLSSVEHILLFVILVIGLIYLVWKFIRRRSHTNNISS